MSRYWVIFCAFFCASKKLRLLAQVSRTSDHVRSVSHAKSFTAQAESSKCRFSRSYVNLPCLVAAIIFPHTKWLSKITDYRDTAALSDQSTVQEKLAVMTGGFLTRFLRNKWFSEALLNSDKCRGEHVYGLWNDKSRRSDHFHRFAFAILASQKCHIAGGTSRN